MKSVCRSRNSAYRVVDQACNTLGEQWEKPHLVSISPYKPPRSNDQNALLHCLFRELAHHTGHTEEEIKTYFKSEFGVKKVLKIGDKPKVIAKSMTEYSRMEMMELIDRVHQVGAECGCVFSEISEN